MRKIYTFDVTIEANSESSAREILNFHLKNSVCDEPTLHKITEIRDDGTMTTSDLVSGMTYDYKDSTFVTTLETFKD